MQSKGSYSPLSHVLQGDVALSISSSFRHICHCFILSCDKTFLQSVKSPYNVLNIEVHPSSLLVPIPAVFCYSMVQPERF